MAQRYVIIENIFDSLSLCSMWEYVQFYFFYLKEQETAKKVCKKKEKEVAVHEITVVQDTAILQNIYPSTSLSMKEMSEPYMAINTFSQMLTVIFQISTSVF